MTKHICTQEDKINKLDNVLDEIKTDIALLLELKEDIKKNSEFRIQSRSIIGFLAFIFAVFGAGIMWVVNKFNS